MYDLLASSFGNPTGVKLLKNTVFQASGIMKMRTASNLELHQSYIVAVEK